MCLFLSHWHVDTFEMKFLKSSDAVCEINKYQCHCSSGMDDFAVRKGRQRVRERERRATLYASVENLAAFSINAGFSRWHSDFNSICSVAHLMRRKQNAIFIGLLSSSIEASEYVCVECARIDLSAPSQWWRSILGVQQQQQQKWHQDGKMYDSMNKRM